VGSKFSLDANLGENRGISKLSQNNMHPILKHIFIRKKCVGGRSPKIISLLKFSSLSGRLHSSTVIYVSTVSL
jgi:hypothetical protein